MNGFPKTLQLKCITIKTRDRSSENLLYNHRTLSTVTSLNLCTSLLESLSGLLVKLFGITFSVCVFSIKTSMVPFDFGLGIFAAISSLSNEKLYQIYSSSWLIITNSIIKCETQKILLIKM